MGRTGTRGAVSGSTGITVELGISWGNRMLDARSHKHCQDIHPDLLEVVELADELCEAEGIDFIITDGCRTLEEQKAFVAAGKSRTMKSRHLGGFAIDYVALVNGRVTYDLVAMGRVAACFKRAAAKRRIPVNWGGDWKTFKDTPHIELCKERYPDA